MSLIDRASAWLQLPREAGPPVHWESSIAANFGPGMGNQPSHTQLLRECLGVAAIAVRTISNRISTLKFEVKESRRDVNGTLVDEILDDHPLAALLARPHPNYTTSKILGLTTHWLLTTGEAYIQKVNTGGSMFAELPDRLDPVSPTQVAPLIHMGEVVGYRITDGHGNQEDRPAGEFIRLFIPDPENPWGAEGYLAPMGIEVDSHSFTHQHVRAHYQNDATPKTTLEAGPDAARFDPAAKSRFEKEWQQRYHQRSGTSMGVPAILPTGYKLIELGLKAKADITPLLEHLRDDILMNFGTPRSLLGQVVAGDRASAETTEWIFDKHTIQPLAVHHAEAYSLDLAPDFSAREVFVGFAPFISEDKAFDLTQEQSDLDRKVKSINEVREDRGLDPVAWGDAPVEEPEPDPEATGDNGDTQDEEAEAEPEADRAALAAQERSEHIRIRQEYRARKRSRAAG